jgi:hypothetical protein
MSKYRNVEISLPVVGCECPVTSAVSEIIVPKLKLCLAYISIIRLLYSKRVAQMQSVHFSVLVPSITADIGIKASMRQYKDRTDLGILAFIRATGSKGLAKTYSETSFTLIWWLPSLVSPLCLLRTEYTSRGYLPVARGACLFLFFMTLFTSRISIYLSTTHWTLMK